MDTRYTLSNGEQISCFFWPDFFENDDWRQFADISLIIDGHKGDEVKVPLQRDDNGLFIVWNNEKVYLNNFDYEPVEVMAKRIQEGVDANDRWMVWDDEIWATCVKDSDNIAFVMDMPAYDMVMKKFGIGIVGDNEMTVLCIPTERGYTKDRWHYKITVECDCEQLRHYIASRNFYFSDFCSLMKSGHIKMVHRDQFKSEKRQELAQYQANQKKLFERVKNFFGAGTKLENPALYIGI